jgi:multisubunit Na+/H+ antiporter MnhB subunit
MARLVAAFLTLIFGVALAAAVLALPDDPAGLTTHVEARLVESGVTQPVTAVLLNFRSYDTWLEVGVLLVALLALLTLQRAPDVSSVPMATPDETVLSWVARLLAPVGVLVGGYLLWLGTHAPGGAFQGGAVIGACGVLLRLAGHRTADALRGWIFRVMALSGFGALLLVAAGLAGAGGAFLEYPPAWAGTLITVVETAIAVCTAFTLAVLFAGGHPTARRQTISPSAVRGDRHRRTIR